MKKFPMSTSPMTIRVYLMASLSYGRIFCLESQKIDGIALFPYFILYFVSNILTL